MKRLMFIAGMAAALALAVTGCKHVPTADVVNLAAKGIGGATGLILNECDLSPEARNATVEIVNAVTQCVPEVGQTLEEAWTPIAQAHVDKLIADGKLDSAEGVLVMTGFKLVVRGFALLEMKYPQVRTYRDLTDAALSGFSAGFLDTFRPTNALSVARVDMAAYMRLRSEALRLRIRKP